jgi:D-sedoheptulose 7-phosphate isomerase
MHKLAELFQSATSFQDYAQRYFGRLNEVLNKLDLDALNQCAEHIEKASREGNTLYIIANGGSAGAAAHMVNDFVAGIYQADQPPWRTLCLADNGETVTALGNDAGFDYIFERQLRVHLKPGDLVLAMSVSGNSPNLVCAMDYAKTIGAVTMAFCGMQGGKLKDQCDVVVHIPTTADEYGPAEDSFAVLGHILTGYLGMRRGKFLHH